jgi:hypothetical protein
MRETYFISPAHSQIELYDPSSRNWADWTKSRDKRICSSEDFVAIATHEERFGRVEVEVTDDPSVRPDGSVLAFDGIVHIRGLTLVVGSSIADQLHEIPVASKTLRLLIFVRPSDKPEFIRLAILAATDET